MARPLRGFKEVRPVDTGRQVRLHQRAHIAEQLVIRVGNPLLTATRFGLNQYRDSDLEVAIDLACGGGGWHPPLLLPE